MNIMTDSFGSEPVSSASSGPRKYMSKRQSACDSCRTRKSACQIETTPPCRLCVALSRSCTFTGHKIKRTPVPSRRQDQQDERNQSLTPTVASSSLELMQVAPGPEAYIEPPEELQPQSSNWIESFFAGNMGNLSPEELSLENPSQTNRRHGTETLGTDLAMEDFDIDYFTEMFHSDQQPQTRERSLDILGSKTAQVCGLSGDMDPYVLRRYRYDENGEFSFSKLSIRTVQDTAIPVQFLLSPPDLSWQSRTETELGQRDAASIKDGREEMAKLISIETGQRLIQLFFKFISPQVPLIIRSHQPDPVSAPVDLLAAIYCISMQFAIYDDRLCIDFAYNPPSVQKLFNIAWKALNRSLHSPTMATVQSGLILLLQPPTNDLVLDSAFKWALLGTVVSTAHTIGLHLDSSQWKLPIHEVLLRRRLSWAVFAFDKWFALSLGRPSHISSNDWLFDQLEQSDVQDEIEDFKPDSLPCLQLSRLTTILSKVLAELYSLKAVSSLTSNYPATLAISKDLLQQLRDCYQNLDLPHQQAPSDDLLSNLDPRLSIHLCYHAINLSIIRALLRPFYHAGATAPEDVQELADWESAKLHCRRGAKASVEAAIRTVSSLKACHYQAFWPPWCKTHFAIIMNMLCFLTITSTFDESGDTLRALNQARQIYRVQSRAFSMVRFALLRIDALFWVGFDELLNSNIDASPVASSEFSHPHTYSA